MLSVEHIRATVAIRLGTWGGIAGPIGFTLAWLGLGAAWPDYDPRTHYISELAASDAPHGVAMVAAFVALGVLMLVFARMLLWALGTGAAARGGAMLIYLFGGTSTKGSVDVVFKAAQAGTVNGNLFVNGPVCSQQTISLSGLGP